MPPTTSKAPTPKRAAVMASIISAAHERLFAHGPTELTIRGIASDLGLSPGALYRYYDGLDAILTELITTAYADLAAALQAATDPAADPLDQVLVTARAYRSWALGHRHQFNLVFGDPIPGYAAPPGGPTSDAMVAASAALLRPSVTAVEAGQLVIPTDFALEDDGQRQLVALIESLSGIALPAGYGVWAMHWWATVHGMVSLELNGQFEWLYGDDAAPQFDAVVTAQLQQFTNSAPS